MSTVTGNLNGFVSKLDDASKAKAKKELNERNDQDRDSAVSALQQWAAEQPWLRTPTDYEFLLRFLRVRKFSQLEARKNIEKYWTLKTKIPKMFMDMDPAEPVTQELLRLGIFYSPRKLDKDGCRIMICSVGRIPLDRVKSDVGPMGFYKLCLMVLEWVIYDENAQVNGLKFVFEYTGASMPLVTAFINPTNNYNSVKFTDGCAPARVKGVYTYNEPPYIDTILSLFTPFMTQKLKDRLKRMGKNLSKLYGYINKEALPEEYLPDEYDGPNAGTEKQIIDDMISDMTSPKFLKHIRDITSSSKYGVDLKSKPEADQEIASFRKLNID